MVSYKHPQNMKHITLHVEDALENRFWRHLSGISFSVQRKIGTTDFEHELVLLDHRLQLSNRSADDIPC